jgi:hypothetical protein
MRHPGGRDQFDLGVECEDISAEGCVDVVGRRTIERLPCLVWAAVPKQF